MPRRALTAFAMLLGSVVSSLATDYDLVVSEGASSVKEAQTVQIFDASGKLKPGDHVISVLYDSLPEDGIECSIAVGGGSAVKASLAKAGEATGMNGALQLASGSPARRAFKAALIELPPHPAATDDKAMARKNLVDKATSMPWAYIAGGAGLLFVVFMLMRRGSSGEPSPILPYHGGRGRKDVIPEIRDRLDKIEQGQHRLVKDPPVLRAFRAQITGFDQRLKQLENTTQTIERALASMAGSLASLDGRVSQAITDDKTPETLRTLGQTVSQLSADTYRRFDESREQVKNVLAIQDKLMPLPGRLESLAAEVKELAQKVHAIDGKLGSSADQSSSALNAIKQQLGDVAGRIAEVEKSQQSLQSLHPLREDVNTLTSRIAEISSYSHASSVKIEMLPGLLGMLNEEIDKKLVALKAELSHVMESMPPVQVVAPAPAVEAPAPSAKKHSRVETYKEPAPAIEEQPEEPMAEPAAELPAEPEVAQEPAEEERLVEEPQFEEPAAEEPSVEEPVVEIPVEEIEELVAQIEPEPEEPIVEISDADAHHEDEDSDASEAPRHVGGGQWYSEGGSARRLWSTEFSRPVAFMQSGAFVRPLTPMDTPAISSPIGGLVFAGSRVAYGHGDAVRAFWPGKEERVVSLDQTLPSDPWRMLVHDSQIFCAEEGAVEMINVNSWSTQGRFEGAYLNQVHTDRNWVGVRAQDGQLAVDLRSDAGTMFGDPQMLEMDAGEPYLLAAADQDAYLASGSGNLFRVGPDGAHALGQVAEGKLLQLSAHSLGLLVVCQDGSQVRVRLLAPDGSVAKEGVLEIENPYERFVVMGNKMYVVSQDTMEVHTLNLKNMKSSGGLHLNGVNRLRRLGGIQHGANHLLMFAADDSSSAKGRVALMNVKSGDELGLCGLNHKHVDLIAADHHVILATSCSYQNIIQVFEPFTARESLRDVA